MSDSQMVTAFGFYNVTVSPNTKLWKYPKSSSDKPLGHVVGVPQGCRAARPGGTAKYGSPEWIKEIAYTADPTDVAAARKWLGPHRLSNDQFAVGCGWVSMNVNVTEIANNGGKFSEQPYSANRTTLFYSLVAAGSYFDPADPTSPFVATDIWISETMWDTNLNEYKVAMVNAANAGSACP